MVDHGIKRIFCCAKQIAIGKLCPAQFIGGGDTVSDQRVSRRSRCPRVEQILIAAECVSASGHRKTLLGVLQNQPRPVRE